MEPWTPTGSVVAGGWDGPGASAMAQDAALGARYDVRGWRDAGVRPQPGLQQLLLPRDVGVILQPAAVRFDVAAARRLEMLGVGDVVGRSRSWRRCRASPTSASGRMQKRQRGIFGVRWRRGEVRE